VVSEVAMTVEVSQHGKEAAHGRVEFLLVA